jgi:ribosome maturation factor RimP
MIEKIDNQQVTIKDCEKVHKAILQISKKNSLGLDDHYDIEVSSSGVDKPLTRLKDYIAAKEKLVKIYALYKIENRRNFKGYLKDVDKDSVKIQLLNKSDVVNLNFEAISEAYLQYEF